ncbi:hypothetical protein KIL84_001057, partial [Mauremys mutica]
FSEATKQFGFISLAKTEDFFQPASLTTTTEPNFTTEVSKLKNVNFCVYLGSTISSDGSLGQELSNRIQKASQGFGRLCHRIFSQHTNRLSTKSMIYNAAMVASLL